MDRCYAAHQSGFLLSYLAAKGDSELTYKDVDKYYPLILELLNTPNFKFQFMRQVRDGILAAYNIMFGGKDGDE